MPGTLTETLKKLPMLTPEEVVLAVIYKNGDEGATLDEIRDIFNILKGFNKVYGTWEALTASIRIMRGYKVIELRDGKYYVNDSKLFGPIHGIAKYVAEKLKEVGL